MDGFCKRKIFLVAGGLFALVATAFSQISTAGIRLGVLPVLDLTHPPLAANPYRVQPDSALEKYFQALHHELSINLQAEESIFLAAKETLATALRARPDFNPFHADSIRQFSASLQLQKLLLPTLEMRSANREDASFWRLRLRWLDAISGEMTKFHVVEYRRTPQDTALIGFDVSAAIRALLDAPELVLAQDQQVARLPTLKDLPPVLTEQPKSRRWLWYLSTTALLGGSSVYWLLNHKKDGGGKRLLPEPPGPPPN